MNVETRAASKADSSPPIVKLETSGLGFSDTWKAMGPGIAAAMTGIGASHIMHAPTAGAQYGYALLWVIPAAYILKYCAFEFSHRYTLVKGESIMNAYHRIGNWPLWYLLFQSVANSFGIAGRTLGCAALIWAAFPFLSLEVWSVIVLLTCIGILWLGKYAAVEAVVKLLIIIFAGSCFIAFFLQAPPPGEYLSRLAPTLPPIGAALLFGAMWGYFPTTLEVAPMQSNWAVDKKSGMVKVRELEAEGKKVELGPNYMRNQFILFKRDMNLSYIVSGLTGVIFLIVGAAVLHPIGLVPASREMGVTIARIYTDTFGNWIFPVIIAGGVAALFSTVFTYYDGQARLVEESAVRLRKSLDTPRTRKLIYRGFQVFLTVAGIGIIYGLPNPIFVVQVASFLALLFSPVLYWLTIESVRRNFKTPEELEFMPSKAMFAWAWFGTAALTIISAYCIWLEFF
jgi:Mn2+/Fe2+ NRAMP family transporter